MTRVATAGLGLKAFVTALAVTAFAFVAAGPASATGVTVTDLDNGATAQAIASALGGGGVAVSNVTYTGANRAGGSFTGGTSSIGFESGVVLSSGNVQTYGGATPDEPCSRGVEGPNNCNEDPNATDGGENGTTLGTPGDTDLDGLLTSQTTEDATSLSFDFVPQQSTVHFSYVFSSEEYNDFANSGFNDIFAFFVNGTNCALVPGTSDAVSVNNINNGNPAGVTTAHHPEFFRDN